MHRMMMLVCHATDGHFADGNREAVRRELNRSTYVAHLDLRGPGQYSITCRDGGRLKLYAPGLNGHRSFHRIDLFLESAFWTPDIADLVFELMNKGGFGLVENLDVPQFIVTQPQQITYFPWLPEPPRLVRSARDLASSIGRVA
jgi:hypothetical protein